MSCKPRCYNIKISNVAYFQFILAARVLMSPLILRGFFSNRLSFPVSLGRLTQRRGFIFQPHSQGLSSSLLLDGRDTLRTSLLCIQCVQVKREHVQCTGNFFPLSFGLLCSEQFLSFLSAAMAYRGDLMACEVDFYGAKNGVIPIVFFKNSHVVGRTSMNYTAGRTELFPYIAMGYQGIRVLAKVPNL